MRRRGGFGAHRAVLREVMSAMVHRFSKRTTSAVPNLRHLSPEMLRLLQEAAEHLEGHVKIERFREGVWPVELRVLRGLQKDGYLQLIATRDQPSKGKVTATYAITPEGRKVAARLASQDA